MKKGAWQSLGNQYYAWLLNSSRWSLAAWKFSLIFYGEHHTLSKALDTTTKVTLVSMPVILKI